MTNIKNNIMLMKSQFNIEVNTHSYVIELGSVCFNKCIKYNLFIKGTKSANGKTNKLYKCSLSYQYTSALYSICAVQ